MKERFSSSGSDTESRKNKRKLLRGAGAAAALLTTGLAAFGIGNNLNNSEPTHAAAPATSAIDTPVPAPEKLELSDLSKERRNLKPAADQIANTLLDLMANPDSHTETLTTAAEGVANKRYIVEHPGTQTPELRAIYDPASAEIYVLGVDVHKDDDGTNKFNRASVSYKLGAGGQNMMEAHARHLDVDTIRQAISLNETELAALSGENGMGPQQSEAHVFFADATTEGLHKSPAFVEASVTHGVITDDTPAEAIGRQSDLAKNAAFSAVAELAPSRPN